MAIAVADDGMVVELRSDGTWTKTTRSAVEPGDFRGVAWGASTAEVQARENREAKYADGDVLVYPQRLVDMDADAVYLFVSGRFARAKYMFGEDFTSANRYLDAFIRVKTLFSGKYGEPGDDRAIWHDDLYREDPDDWGRAVERGDLTFIASWATPRTEIVLLLHGNDYQSHLEVEYTSILLKSWAESVKNDAEHDLI